jgi:hypothetical protein
MTHPLVGIAKHVLDNKQNYPEVIVAQAANIVGWSTSKRIAMQWLWTHHTMLKVYIKARNSLAGPTSPVKRARHGSVTLRISCNLSKADGSLFHKAKNYLGRTKNDMLYNFLIFENALKALDCAEVGKMLQYISCVNARRPDDSLESVAFMGYVHHNVLAEILAWRLASQSIT